MNPDLTSLHIGKAVEGEPASCAWLVDHFSPALLAQANYRLQGRLRSLCEPEDLVQDVWLTALPRLSDLVARDGRWTPVVLRFLATTLVRKINHLLRKSIAIARDPAAIGGGEHLPATDTGVVSRVSRREHWQSVSAAIEALPSDERELLVLRGIEQMTNREIAQKLGIPDYEATRRYGRALDHLRTTLPGSVFADLAS